MTTTTETAADADADDAGSSGSDAELPPQSTAAPPEPALPEPAPHEPAPPDPHEPAPSPIEIEVIVSETATGPAVAQVDPGRLRGTLRAAVGRLGHPVRRVSVLVVDDATMASLHERHAGIAGPTDVLTFPGSDSGQPIDADIAVNADEAARQSASRRHDAGDELLLYALHGLLHCAGFDDHESADFDAMHAEEDRILAEIDVGATFAPARRTSGRGGTT